MSLTAVALIAAAGFAQARVTGDAAVLANAITALQGAAPPLHVTTSSFTPSPRDTVPGTLDDKYTADGGNISPSISWTRGPAGTQYYALLMEGVDVVDGHPVMHWVMYNIPSTVTTVPEHVPAEMHLEYGALKGAMQGRLQGSAGYYGPRAPSGATKAATGTGEAMICLMICRIAVSNPPGVSIFSTTNRACSAAAAFRPRTT